jgi:hypothetical protein
MLASAAVAAAVPPLLLRGEPAGFDALRSRINALPRTERDRLARQFDDYLHMDESHRAHYQQLHVGLQHDVQQEGGRLSRAKDDYFAWRQTLPIPQQQRLETTTDPAERINLVEQFVDEQQKRRAEEEMRQMWRDPSTRFMLWIRMPILSAAELSAAMSELEKSISFRADQQQRLDARTGIERHLELFKLLDESGRKVTQVVNDAAADRIIQSLPAVAQSWISESLERDRERGSRVDRVRTLFFLLSSNLKKKVDDEMRLRQPDESDLLQFVAAWPPDQDQELDDLLSLEPENFVREVRERYAAEHLQLDASVIWKTFPPEWRPPPRPDGPGRRLGRGEGRGGPADRGGAGGPAGDN